MGRGANEIEESVVGADGRLYKRGRRRSTAEPPTSPPAAKSTELSVFAVCELTNLTEVGYEILDNGGFSEPLTLEPDTQGSSPRAPERPVLVSTQDGNLVGIIPIVSSAPIIKLLEHGDLEVEGRFAPESTENELWISITTRPV